VALRLDDPILNRVLPINSAPPPPGCSDVYQATRARAFADWGNGGSAAGDTLQGVDVSRHVTLASSDSSAALVMGTTIKVRRCLACGKQPARSLAGCQTGAIRQHRPPSPVSYSC
jgi:hypothetical protein